MPAFQGFRQAENSILREMPKDETGKQTARGGNAAGTLSCCLDKMRHFPSGKRKPMKATGKTMQGGMPLKSAAAGVAGCMLLALGLRCHGLDDIAANLDELNLLCFLGTNSLRTFLTAVHYPNPESVPLYFVLMYFSRHVLTDSLAGLRFINVLISLTAIPLLYGLTARIFNRRAGLAAAFFLALSPLQLWHGQTTRFYVLVVPLILLSGYAVYRALESGNSRWLKTALFANAALVWTHLFTMIPIVLELVFVVFANRRPNGLRWRGVAIWLVLHVLVMLSPMPWMQIAGHRIPAAEINQEHQPPSFEEYVYDLAGDDAVEKNRDIDIAYFPEIAGVPGLREQVRQWHPVMDQVLTGVFLAVILAGSLVFLAACWQVFLQRRQDEAALRRFQGVGILLLIGVLPVTAHFVLSHVWRPCIQPRFTLYSAPALYALAGGCIGVLRFAWIRRAAIAVMAALFVYQLVIILPAAATRTDWVSAVRYIRPRIGPDEPLFSRVVPHVRGPLDWFRYHWGRDYERSYTVYALEAIAQKTERLFYGSENPPETAWAAINHENDARPFDEGFELALRSRGLAFERRIFPGCRNVYVYRITSDPATRRETPVHTPTRVDYAAYIAEMGIMNHVPPEDADRMEEALRRTTEYYLPWHGLLLPLALSDESYTLAYALAEDFFDRHGQNPMISIYMAFAEQGRGNPAAALRHARIVTADPDPWLEEYRPLLPYYKAFFEEGPEAARPILEDIDPEGMFTWQFYRQAAGMAPRFGACLRNAPAGEAVQD
jgi:4-amino-4-deoxy-L-arabinose transferase-like glycosyltransferase